MNVRPRGVPEMRQVQQRRQSRPTRPPELDLCTPSGRPLPF
ncbi:MAG TPA: hypothetical protein VF423_08365 [Actinomycetes bacterium]